MERLICVLGPTACGKTTLGVRLARQLGGEVVSVDSMQLYRGLTIGTAAPTAMEMAGVPHHMVAVAEPGESWSVARFVRAADACIRDILRRGKQPILVGGTGLYLEGILRGTDFAPGRSGGEIRCRLEERLAAEGMSPLLEELAAVDPVAAARLHPADEKRILRALEVYLESGKTITQHNEESRQRPPRYQAVKLGLAFSDREEMKRLIDQRVDAMVEQGLLDEVRWLLAQQLPPEATAWQAIGYKEFLGVAEGRKTTAQAVEEVKLRSRQYAKRQLTWLRRETDIQWIFWEGQRDFDRALQISTDILSSQGVK